MDVPTEKAVEDMKANGLPPQVAEAVGQSLENIRRGAPRGGMRNG